MSYVFRKKYVALLAALIISMSNVYADKCESSAPACCAEPVCQECFCQNFWIDAEFIYLRTCEGGFGCGYGDTSITNTIVDGIVTTDIVESDREIDFEWAPGFRVGAGYAFDCSCWDIAVFYTHLYEKGHAHHDDNSAHWKLTFNEADAAVGYKLNYCDCFTFRPFFGARYARIHQSFHSHLESPITIVRATTVTDLAISTKNDTEHFWGAGPLFGFEGDFDVGCGFSVYGDLAGNFLFGKFRNKFNDTDFFTTATSGCNSHSKSCAVLTGYDAGIGVRYCICGVTIQLGVEQHAYFDFNKIGCNGDLNLYGFNAGVRYTF